MPNTNTETGIPYGVISGNAVPYLLDEITTSGESTTFAAYKRELTEAIAAALRGVAEDRTGGERAARIVEQMDCEQLAESMLDSGLNDALEFDEEEFEHTETVKVDGAEFPVKYLLGYLGGAPLIWVCDSPYVARAAHCSPCVPGAGDLDNMREDGAFCYCCPPDAFDTEDETADRYGIIGETEINGRKYKIVGKPAEPAA
jgi:hypothetical protein